jgi:hypothetical protein
LLQGSLSRLILDAKYAIRAWHFFNICITNKVVKTYHRLVGWRRLKRLIKDYLVEGTDEGSTLYERLLYRRFKLALQVRQRLDPAGHK